MHQKKAKYGQRCIMCDAEVNGVGITRESTWLPIIKSLKGNLAQQAKEGGTTLSLPLFLKKRFF
ncbi:hypothetical protein [Pectobacterium cacticida]|uniref:hypothetical protein n=1 Tax=Pectobacterium cacticida TaxID=69221 RepID=UPI002FF35E90